MCQLIGVREGTITLYFSNGYKGKILSKLRNVLENMYHIFMCSRGEKNNNPSKMSISIFFVFLGGQKLFGTKHLFFYIFKTQTN